MIDNVKDIDGSPASVNAVLESLYSALALGRKLSIGGYVEVCKELATVQPSSAHPVGEKPNVIAEHWGSGVLNRVWCAIGAESVDSSSPSELGMNIRVFIDDPNSPVIDVPISVFFFYASCGGVFSNERVSRTSRTPERSGGTRQLNVSYDAYMRVEVVSNVSVEVAPVYFSAGYTRTSEPLGLPRYRTKYKDVTAGRFDEVVVCDIQGTGSIESVFYSFESSEADDYSVLEGNINIEVDGDLVISASGIEDFFLGSWYILPVGGYPAGRAGDSNVSGTSVALYRFFDGDSIGYSESLKITLQVGERDQGYMKSDSYSVRTAIGYFDREPTPDPRSGVKSVDLLVGNFSGEGVPHPSWKQASDREQAVVHDGSIKFAQGDQDSYNDRRVWIDGSYDLGDEYIVETRMKWTGTTPWTDAGLLLRGQAPDPYFGAACHVQLTSRSESKFTAAGRDDFSTPCFTQIAQGDLSGKLVWLVAEVRGDKITAYYRLDNSSVRVPIGSWTTGQAGTLVGIFSWRAGVEFDRFSVRSL